MSEFVINLFQPEMRIRSALKTIYFVALIDLFASGI